MTPPTCGLVLAPRRLVAVVLGPGGEARRAVRAALTDDGRYGLVTYLASLGAEIVTAEGLIRSDAVVQRAIASGLIAWATPDILVVALARAAAITDPARTAAMLARLPQITLLRAQLRRLTSVAVDPRQVPLL